MEKIRGRISETKCKSEIERIRAELAILTADAIRRTEEIKKIRVALRLVKDESIEK